MQSSVTKHRNQKRNVNLPDPQARTAAHFLNTYWTGYPLLNDILISQVLDSILYLSTLGYRSQKYQITSLCIASIHPNEAQCVPVVVFLLLKLLRLLFYPKNTERKGGKNVNDQKVKNVKAEEKRFSMMHDAGSGPYTCCRLYVHLSVCLPLNSTSTTLVWKCKTKEDKQIASRLINRA